MEKSNFWNDACRGGAIIGLAMAVSNVAEQAMLLKGGIGMYGLVTGLPVSGPHFTRWRRDSLSDRDSALSWSCRCFRA